VMAGCASLRLDDGLAQLCGAATLPEFRRRGIQTAFLNRRLAEAVAEGCDLALVTTQPGSKSQENSQRQGFTLLYSRAMLVKPPAT
jgi:GNAT superfamily N-acetyltransferase